MLVCVIAVAGCAWVAPTSGGALVRLEAPAQVLGCEKVGRTHSSTKDRVWVFARGSEKVREELETLARNEAARMGGDRIVAESGVENGRQTYGVYRCDS